MGVPRRIVDLGAADLPALPEPCRTCVFWEAPGSALGRDAAATAKEAWWQAAQLEWGLPGKAAWVDDRLVAYATYAPRAHFPRARSLGPSASEDALLLATLWVDPEAAGAGLGTALVHAVLRETARRGARALEAYGVRGAGSGCVIPEAFLLRQGFAVHHDHVDFPLLRLDLRQTARWQETVGHALDGVRTALGRRERVPVPVRPAVPVAAGAAAVTDRPAHRRGR